MAHPLHLSSRVASVCIATVLALSLSFGSLSVGSSAENLSLSASVLNSSTESGAVSSGSADIADSGETATSSSTSSFSDLNGIVLVVTFGAAFLVLGITNLQISLHEKKNKKSGQDGNKKDPKN